MNKKQLLNEEFLKSIESKYIFSNIPINRLKSCPEDVDIKSQLENLRNKIKLVENCDLRNYSNKIVFGDGNFNSKIMIVGDGPDEEDVKIGKPFMGEVGSLLDRMLSAINLKRESVYITNLLNYITPDDRKPTSAEINRYLEFLIEHIFIINPKILVIVGSTAMEALVGKNIKISRERGQWKELLFKKAQKVMPGGVSSPVRSFKSVGGIPPFIRRGDGAILTDSENNKYIDFVGSYGPAILGHCNSTVTEAIKNQSEKGLCFGAPSELETELASLIIDAINSIEKMRT